MNLFFRRALGITTIFAMFLGFAPLSARAAWLGAPTDVAVVGGIYTNDTTPTITWTRPADATWYQILVDDGEWTNLSNVSSYTVWSLSNGWHTFYVRANNSNSMSVSSSVTFEIDTTGPTVPAVSPSTATEDRSTTFSVTPSGDAATSYCDLYVSGSSVGSMTKNGSTFTKNYTFTNDGNYTMYARCADGDGNYTTGSSRTVVVSNVDVSDTFSVPAVSPSTAVEDQSTTFSVTPYGTLEAIACNLYVSGSSVGSMNQSSNTFSKNYTFSNDGSYTVYAWCENENGDWIAGTSRTVTVSDVDDSESFTVPSVSPSTATEDESTTFSVTPYGTLDADQCTLYISGSSVGPMSETSSNTFTKSYTFSNDGNYTVYAYCEDENGNWEYGTSRTVTVYERNSNNNALDVPTVSTSTAYEDERTEFTVRPTSDYNVTNCWLYVDGARVATMDEESTNRFVADYTFRNDGNYSVYAYCTDSAGASATSDKRTVRVSDDRTPIDEAEYGSLIKVRCGVYAHTSETCKAVYYYGSDGKRHVFANESVFFSWYNDFDNVVEVSQDFMSSLTIGKNVTYRPGSVVVKFDSSSKVYAIEASRTLRHYTTLSLLKSDYGNNWMNVLVRVPDALYNNYTIGNEIDNVRDYDRDDAYYSVDSIDDVL